MYMYIYVFVYTCILVTIINNFLNIHVFTNSVYVYLHPPIWIVSNFIF